MGICASFQKDRHWIFTERSNALLTWRDANGVVRCEIPVALADLTFAEKLLIARLSVTVTTHRLAHGGVASTGHVATFPKPIESIAELPPELPPDETIVRVRRGATEGLDRKKNMLYTARRKRY